MPSLYEVPDVDEVGGGGLLDVVELPVLLEVVLGEELLAASDGGFLILGNWCRMPKL